MKFLLILGLLAAPAAPLEITEQVTHCIQIKNKKHKICSCDGSVCKSIKEVEEWLLSQKGPDWNKWRFQYNGIGFNGPVVTDTKEAM